MKIIGVVLLMGLFILPSFAECNCTGDEIINKINYASSSKRQDLFSSLLKSSSFAPSYLITDDFANIIKASKNEYGFQEAVKYYITHYCKVQNGNIICN